MFKLPVKLISVLVITFAFLFLFRVEKIFALQTNPQADLEDSSVQKYIDDQNKCWEKAKIDGTPCVYDDSVDRGRIPGQWLTLASGIMRINPNPEIAQFNKPALETLAAFMGTLYEHPPASSIAYIYDVANNAGFVQPAYAQGIGFAALSPFLPYWKASRNLAYSVLIIIMIAIGFMVIFRMKIDPKTVITVQAAIPKIVITLLIITLSYPIAGFFIDMMYLVMAISISMLLNAAGGQIAGADVNNLQTAYLTSDLGDLFKGVFWAGWPIVKGLGGILAGLFGGTFGATSILSKFFAHLAVSVPWVSLGIPALLIFIIALGLLFTFIRLALLLLNSYIQLLIGVILGPIFLLAEAIPGRSAFSQWLLNIIANLVVFPATAIIIMFSVFLATTGESGTVSWSPPFIGIGGDGGLFNTFLALGVIFLTPTLVAQIKKQFHPKAALPITAGTAFAPLTGGAQSAMSAASSFYYMTPILEKFGIGKKK